ncbi:MAG: hypothetical protein GC160_16375 [Acidobacteria bacterium]|nr:hypothetical protein [Acidobacteriota bacterium]
MKNQEEGRLAEVAQAAKPSCASDSHPQLRDSGVFGPSLGELRPSGRSQARQLHAVSLPSLKHSDILLPLQPAVDRERLRPASFPNIKAVQRPILRMPSADGLRPVKLVTKDSLPPPKPAPVPPPQAFARPSRGATAAPAPAPEPSIVPARPPLPASLLVDSQDGLRKSQQEPLWHALFAPTGQRRQEPERSDPVPGRAREAYVERAKASFDWGAAGNIEIDDLTDSKTESAQIAPLPEPKRVWFWQAIEGVFLSRTFARALAVVTIALFASTLDVPWRDWLRKQAAQVQRPVSTAVAQLSKPIRDRAAFFIVDDFTDGVDHWLTDTKLDVDPAGWLTVEEGLALRGDTTNLENYRFDFDAKIQTRAVGWLVRAPDKMNYYAFKLHQSGSEKAPIYSLSRYSMIDGIKSISAASIDVPAHLARADDFNRISVRVVGDHVTTLLNGWGVDFWQDQKLPRGGVGLLADAGEEALVRKMTVSGNDDTWGLLLYGALESMRSVQDFFVGGSTAPAAFLFHRPILPHATEAMVLRGPATSE